MPRRTDRDACYLDQLYQLHAHFITVWPSNQGPVTGFLLRPPWGPGLRDWKSQSGQRSKALLHFEPPPGFEIPHGKTMAPRPRDLPQHFDDYCESTVYADSLRRYGIASYHKDNIPALAPLKVLPVVPKIPTDESQISDMDKELLRMKEAGASWAEIQKQWSRMTGRAYAKGSLQFRFANLKRLRGVPLAVQTYPPTWAEASPADKELVRMKHAGHSWKDIDAKWIATTGKSSKYPPSWSKASAADKTLVNMKEANRTWSYIHAQWLQMTGEDCDRQVLDRRFCRLRILKHEDISDNDGRDQSTEVCNVDDEIVRMKKAGRPNKHICDMYLEMTGKSIQPKTLSQKYHKIMLETYNYPQQHLERKSQVSAAKRELVRMKEAGRPLKEICAMWLERTGKTIYPSNIENGAISNAQRNVPTNRSSDDASEDLYARLETFNNEEEITVPSESSIGLEQSCSVTEDFTGLIDPLLLEQDHPVRFPAIDMGESTVLHPNADNGFEESGTNLNQIRLAMSQDLSLLDYNRYQQYPLLNKDGNTIFEPFINFGQAKDAEDVAAVDYMDTEPDLSADPIIKEEAVTIEETIDAENVRPHGQAATGKENIAGSDTIAKRLRKRNREDDNTDNAHTDIQAATGEENVADGASIASRLRKRKRGD
ncbi:MAG: hypothetical protein Q9220_002253 [cf. Caloplaca sp. 1 TL-2023]